MKEYGFIIGTKYYTQHATTEKNALIALVKNRWEEIDKYETIRLLGGQFEGFNDIT